MASESMMDIPDGLCSSRTKPPTDDMFEDDDERPSAGTSDEGIASAASAADMCSQPATQPLDALIPNGEEELMDTDNDLQDSWGILFPLQGELKKINLTKNTMSFGRSTANDFIFTDNHMNARRFGALSKVHFTMWKQDEIVYIKDSSSNGTFVNGTILGKGKKRPIEHNSYISLTEPNYKVFAFMKGIQTDEQFPVELTSKYHVSRELGKGACGVVRLGFKESNNERVAIKIIDKKNTKLLTSKSSNNIMNEVKILQSLDHPNVINLVDFIETDSELFIILELANGGELFDKIILESKLSEPEAKFHFYQIASGIKYLHSKNIAHRDLKPENILLDNKNGNSRSLVKITDMGLSKIVDMDTVLKTFCGTPQYLAPEILKNRARGGNYTLKVDCWSLGVILYILISGSPPFTPDRRDGPDLVLQILQGDYSFKASIWSKVSKEVIDLITKLLTVEPENRLTSDEILEHPWFANDPKAVKLAESVMFNTPFDETDSNDNIESNNMTDDKTEDEDRTSEDMTKPIIRKRPSPPDNVTSTTVNEIDVKKAKIAGKDIREQETRTPPLR